MAKGRAGKEESHACLPTKAGKDSKDAKKEKTPVRMAKGRAGKEKIHGRVAFR
jgi:hypothetical protein